VNQSLGQYIGDWREHHHSMRELRMEQGTGTACHIK
jgi:hypothetical protein